jgi:CubicO group peptidase (beta-lactamase class C family)
VRRGLLAAIVIVPWLTAGAQPSQLTPIDSAFDAVRRGAKSPAVAIVVVHRDAIVYANVAGYADLERGLEATPATRFDLASIAKQFTAFAISHLVEQGRISVTDDVRRHVPELDLGGASITIGQLLHHTSGLEDTDGLLALAGSRAGDVVSHDDVVRLLTRQQHVRFAPGSSHSYSNGGYSLLAEVVQRITRRSFAELTDSLLFAPLGMSSSGFLESPFDLIPNRALPYRRNRAGGFRSSTSDLYPGAGGLFASIDDMGRWLRHLLVPRRDRDATLRLRRRGILTSGDTIDYAWGLVRRSYRGREAFQHSGSGPATAAQLLIIPELEFGVVAAIAGDAAIDPSAIAFQAADLVLRDSLAPRQSMTRGPRAVMLTEEMLNTRPAESHGVTVSPAIIQRYAGTYAMSDGSTLVVRARADTLDFAFDGRLPFIPLWPLPDGRFVMVPTWDVYRFELPERGSATNIVREPTPRSMRGVSSGSLRGERRDESVFTVESAAPFVGIYYSLELEAFYRVALERGRLVLVHARHGALPLVPLGPDRFAVQGGGIAGARFAGDGRRMTGLELEAVSWGTRAAFRRVQTMLQ